jgi:FkbM family methyltransferase
MDKPPYSPLAFTPSPLLMAPYKGGLHRFGWPYAISVVFLNGADRLDQEYRLFGGQDDGELIEYTVSMAELEARLKPVSPHGNGRLLDYRGKDMRVELERTLFMPDVARNSEELPMVPFLKALMGHGRTFVDVGAYIGLYTVGLALAFERVLAFEPSRFSYPWLRRNIALNGYQHVVSEHVALSDNIGDQTLYISSGDGFVDSLIPKSADGNIILDRYAVPTQTLDSHNLADVDLIKMDVQGHEMAVLRGARQTINASRPVILVDVCDDTKRQLVRSVLGEMDYSCDFMFPLTPSLALCLASERRRDFEWFI